MDPSDKPLPPLASAPPGRMPGRPLADEVAKLPDLLFAAQAVLTAGEQAPAVEPLSGFFLRAGLALGATRDPEVLLAWWESRTPGNLQSASRYRWELTHRFVLSTPEYAGDTSAWCDFRAGTRDRSRGDPFSVEEQLLLPILIAENGALLLELAERPALANCAEALMKEAAPRFRRDYAHHVQMQEPWSDTFALWCLAREPRVLSVLHPLAVAIAACYAAAEPGPVLGTRYPFHNKPLVSASAQLASALMTLGSDLELVSQLVEFVKDSRRDDGGWGDADQTSEPLTTLVAAEVLSCMDPSFDPAPTIAYFAAAQGADGMWRAVGPEAPWLTYQIVRWSVAARRSFGERFRWPHRAASIRDHKTGLPFFGYFVELAGLFAALPGLSASWVEVAFIDLIGFRAFNNRFGQSAGDEVLRVLAQHLDTISATRTIRDGGDEFVIVGAPTRKDLGQAIEAFRQAWPQHFREVFGADVPPVTPRILVGRTRASSLRDAREALGRGITDLKVADNVDPELGILVDVGEL